MMDLEDAGLVVVGDIPIYVEPGNARSSVLIQKLNPMVQFPIADANTRLLPTTAHGQDQGFSLTPAEMLLLVRMADFGGQFYSRENAPGSTY